MAIKSINTCVVWGLKDMLLPLRPTGALKLTSLSRTISSTPTPTFRYKLRNKGAMTAPDFDDVLLEGLFPAPTFSPASDSPSAPKPNPGITPESTAALRRLLVENHKRFHVFFNDMVRSPGRTTYFSTYSRTDSIFITIYPTTCLQHIALVHPVIFFKPRLTGMPPTNVRPTSRQKLLLPATGPNIWGMKSTFPTIERNTILLTNYCSIFQYCTDIPLAPAKPCAQFSFYNAYMGFFAAEIKEHGLPATLERFVFSHDANRGHDNPRMLDRFLAGLFHPLIHFGHSPEFGVDGMAVEGPVPPAQRSYLSNYAC